MIPMRRRPRLPVWPAWALVGALLLAQSLGWLHRLAHGGPATGAQAAVWSDGHESGTPACRLVDQLAHADAVCAPPAAAAAVVAWTPAPIPASDAALHGSAPLSYDARGPPAA